MGKLKISDALQGEEPVVPVEEPVVEAKPPKPVKCYGLRAAGGGKYEVVMTNTSDVSVVGAPEPMQYATMTLRTVMQQLLSEVE